MKQKPSIFREGGQVIVGLDLASFPEGKHDDAVDAAALAFARKTTGRGLTRGEWKAAAIFFAVAAAAGWLIVIGMISGL